MKLNSQLNLNLSQKLHINQSMKLSLKILQMNWQELTDFLEEEQKENILLEVKAPRPLLSSNSQNYDKAIENLDNPEKSFYDFLYEQIGELKLSEKLREICEYIADNIDARGYLSHRLTPPYKAKEFKKALQIIRSLEPRGVGARDLKDCLLLQLGESDTFERLLVENYLKELAYGDIELLIKITNIKRSDLERAIKKIKGLNPTPSKGYYVGEKKVYVAPDAFIKVNKGLISVEMNGNIIPSVSTKEIKASESDDKFFKYLKKCAKRSEFIAACIKQRNMVLNDIIIETTKIQSDYILGGELRPLTLESIAGTLGINQSTVSRAIKNRYVQLGGETIPLKSLFAKGFNGKASTANKTLLTRELIKREISQIIASEDKLNPYPDLVIGELLKKKKIEVSRRTIAKYRGELGLGCSGARRFKRG